MSISSYSESTIREIESVLSSDRFETYLLLAHGDKKEALVRYRENIVLSHKLFTILHLLEVCLRNKIDHVFCIDYGSNWLESEKIPFTLEQQKSLQSSRIDLNKKYSSLQKHGHIIASLGFGFWAAFFNKTFEEIWRHSLRKIFKEERPLKRSQIAHDLRDLRQLRNRIAHHECILRINNYEQEENAFRIIGWLSPAALIWLKTDLIGPA